MDVDLTVLPYDELALDLDRLQAEERQLSRRRDQLHRRIEFLKSGGGAYNNATKEQLASIEGEEQYVSKTRLELHRRIDRIRIELLRRDPDA